MPRLRSVAVLKLSAGRSSGAKLSSGAKHVSPCATPAQRTRARAVRCAPSVLPRLRSGACWMARAA
eukprot:1207676-Lingulodinium_polyedra.AAC.1